MRLKLPNIMAHPAVAGTELTSMPFCRIDSPKSMHLDQKSRKHSREGRKRKPLTKEHLLPTH